MNSYSICRYDTILADASAALADKWVTVEVGHSCVRTHTNLERYLVPLIVGTK